MRRLLATRQVVDPLCYRSVQKPTVSMTRQGVYRRACTNWTAEIALGVKCLVVVVSALVVFLFVSVVVAVERFHPSDR